jgi:hypothetical protein
MMILPKSAWFSSIENDRPTARAESTMQTSKFRSIDLRVSTCAGFAKSKERDASVGGED